jgi:CBS domain containing-hemolysin-like protein
MSSRKVKGAKTAVKLIQNADKVSSFCNDVIGDICGIISGSAGSIISVTLASTFSINIFITTLITTAVIASLTIGGKALGKSYAINKNNLILYQFAKFLSYFKGE